MATVGKNIHKQRICTIKRKNFRKTYSTVVDTFSLLRHRKAQRECTQRRLAKGRKKSKDTVMSLLFYFSIFVWAELFSFSGVIKRFWLKYVLWLSVYLFTLILLGGQAVTRKLNTRNQFLKCNGLRKNKTSWNIKLRWKRILSRHRVFKMSGN